MPDTPELPPTVIPALDAFEHAVFDCARGHSPVQAVTAAREALAAAILADRATRLAAAPQGWKPIETAPKDGTQILLGHPADTDEDGEPRPGVVAQGYWQEGYDDAPDQMGHDACWTDCNFDAFTYPRSFGAEAYRSKGYQPTHWMPLPPAPDAAPAASSPASHPAMFDAFGNPRKRYVRLTVDGSHCVDKPENLTDNIGDMAPGEYTTADVFLSEREFNDLPEFDGF